MATEVCINIEKLIDSQLSCDEYVICALYAQQDHATLRTFANFLFLNPDVQLSEWVDELEKRGYLKRVGDNTFTEVVPLVKFTDMFRISHTEAGVSDVITWINEYRELFKGLKPGGMGDKNACLDKMQKFVRKNPQYTKEQILNATTRYIESCKPHYTYLQYADYFIYKQDTEKTIRSRLLGFLEDEGNGTPVYDKVMMI